MNRTAREAADGFNWGLLLLLSTGYLAVSVNMQGFLALLPFVREEFVLTRAQAGMYSAFYFISATAIAIFAGRAVDFLGSKKGMLMGVGSMGFFMLLHAVAPIFPMVLGLAFLTGLGFSVITPSVNKGVMERVHPERRAVSMGIMQSGGGIGGFMGASLLPMLGEMVGWRWAVVFGAVFALLITLVIQFGLREKKPESLSASGAEEDAEEGRPSSFKADLLVLLKNKYLLTVCVLGICFGFSMGAVPAHFTIFLYQDLGISRALAGLGLGALQLGGLLGRPCWGWISDNLLEGSRRKGLFAMSMSMGLMFLLFGLVINDPQLSMLFVFLCSFVLGFCALAWPGLHFTAVAELASEKYTGTATGLALIFTRLGVVFSPPVFGLIADVHGTYEYSWILMSLSVVVITSAFFVLTAGKEQSSSWEAEA